jgi:hypothetical protein
MDVAAVSVAAVRCPAMIIAARIVILILNMAYNTEDLNIV